MSAAHTPPRSGGAGSHAPATPATTPASFEVELGTPGSSAATVPAPAQPATGFLSKLLEAAGAARELLYDGDLRKCVMAFSGHVPPSRRGCPAIVRRGAAQCVRAATSCPRRKAVPFLMAEGSRALQELQKGLSRNALALGRQLQGTAAGQFGMYVARLLDRTAYQRQGGRAEQYNQPAGIWIGRTLHRYASQGHVASPVRRACLTCRKGDQAGLSGAAGTVRRACPRRRDMPHEIRTRFWVVLLEHPELIDLLKVCV